MKITGYYGGFTSKKVTETARKDLLASVKTDIPKGFRILYIDFDGVYVVPVYPLMIIEEVAK